MHNSHTASPTEGSMQPPILEALCTTPVQPFIRGDMYNPPTASSQGGCIQPPCKPCLSGGRAQPLCNFLLSESPFEFPEPLIL